MADMLTNAPGEGGLSEGGGAFLGGAVPAATGLAGGVLDQAIFQPQQNRASGRQAAQIDPFLDSLMALGEQVGSGGDYGGLRGQAQRELATGSGALNAQLASRGLFDSGVAMSQQRQLSGDVMSQLAQAINQDQLQRAQFQAGTQQFGAQTVASTPGYQYFDRDSGRVSGK